MSVRARTWKTASGEEKRAWIVDYFDGAGDRHIRTFERKKDADAYRATVHVDVRKGTHVAPSKSATLADAADLWIKRVEADGRERTTVKQYREHVAHILPRLGARTKIAQLTVERIKSFRDELLAPDTGLSRPMARKVLVSLKSLLKASQHGHLGDGVSIKRIKRDERKIEVGRDIPTTNEVRRLVAAAKPGRQRALVLVAALCGLRASELRGLRWADVDLKAAKLTVNQRADRYGKIGRPKTESSVRELDLDPRTVAELREWRLACPKGAGDFVFPTRTGRAEHHANMLRSLAALEVEAGVVDKKGNPKYAMHAFRHFFASWSLNRKSEGGRELPASEVQKLLGHSSFVMTVDVYGHLFPRRDGGAELAAASNALFG